MKDAISQPNKDEILRERLIREGTIVPKIDEALEDMQENIKNIYLELQKLALYFESQIDNELSNGAITSHYFNALKNMRAFAECFKKYQKSSQGRILINFYYALSMKQFKLVEMLAFDSKLILSNVVSVVRSGFFFSFKENMRNNP